MTSNSEWVILDTIYANTSTGMQAQFKENTKLNWYVSMDSIYENTLTSAVSMTSVMGKQIMERPCKDGKDYTH